MGCFLRVLFILDTTVGLTYLTIISMTLDTCTCVDFDHIVYIIPELVMNNKIYYDKTMLTEEAFMELTLRKS